MKTVIVNRLNFLFELLYVVSLAIMIYSSNENYFIIGFGDQWNSYFAFNTYYVYVSWNGSLFSFPGYLIAGTWPVYSLLILIYRKLLKNVNQPN